MKLNKNFSAFTLTELLIALVIIGAIASMTIPSLINGLHKRTLTTQLKSIVGSIQQLANDQMVMKNTKNLDMTDFRDPAKLLTEKNFPIAQNCNRTSDCWTESYKTLENQPATRILEGNPISIKLKSGTIISYQLYTGALNLDDGDKGYGIFRIDVNGSDKPNVIGRDVFWFYISKKGRILNHVQVTNGTYNEANAIAGCKNETFITACLSVIQENNWTMPY